MHDNVWNYTTELIIITPCQYERIGLIIAVIWCESVIWLSVCHSYALRSVKNHNRVVSAAPRCCHQLQHLQQTTAQGLQRRPSKPAGNWKMEIVCLPLLYESCSVLLCSGLELWWLDWNAGQRNVSEHCILSMLFPSLALFNPWLLILCGSSEDTNAL